MVPNVPVAYNVDVEQGKVDPLVGQLVDGKYRIQEKIGGGGMGIVYKATHELMGRTVAMKLLHRHLMTGEGEQQFLDRFRTEARAASLIEHPNAVTIHDFGMHEIGPYLIMQYVEGPSLRSIVRADGALEISRILLLMIQVCSAVHEAHRLGIVHRDLKPDNIVVTRRSNGEERAIVLDFGIAKMIGSDGDNMAITKTGNILGTPQYMAPEQVRGAGALEPRSDLYTLGIILYELCTGKVPFDSDSAIGLMMKHLNDRPPPFRTVVPGTIVPSDLEEVVLQALEKEPENRQPTVRALGEQLEAIARTHVPGLASGAFRSDTLGVGSTATVPVSSGTISAPATTEESATPGSKTWLFAAIGVLGAAVISLVLLFAFGGEKIVAPDPVVPTPAPVMPTAVPTVAQQQPTPTAVPSTTQLSQAAEEVFSRAEQAQKAGIWTEAEQLYKEVLTLAPGHAKSYYNLGDVYLSQKRSLDAVAALTQATKLAPEDAGGYSLLAFAHQEAGQLEEAITAYKQTIVLKPGYALAYNNLGFAYLQANKLDEAEDAFKQCLRLDRSYARAFFNLSELYQRKGDWKRAITAQLGGVSADPKNASAHVSLGDAYRKVGESKKAAEAYRKALSINPDYDAAIEKLEELGVR